jgi:hypothetical protein
MPACEIPSVTPSLVHAPHPLIGIMWVILVKLIIYAFLCIAGRLCWA